jgi:ABC-type multidrug transport system permease subunit
MAEMLIAVAPLLGLAALALVGVFVPLKLIASAAISLMGVGLLFGVPCGIYYHLLLRRALILRGSLPRGWYWNPARYHAELDDATERGLRPWIISGALGFGLIMLGLLLAITALVLWFRGQRDVFSGA